MAVIAVSDISKVYGRGPQATAALREVSLTIGAGAICGLIGPNGAGKTTLIKILAGLLRPDTGGGTVLGFDLLRRHHAVRARVSLVAPTADVGIDNSLTVRQNLDFWAPVYGLRGQEARRRVAAVLERLDLLRQADAWPMHISAGQRQRLALARSLLARTPLLFLDEPTNKLDLEGVRSVRNLIAELNREHGVTVILTTHVMEEAEELCSEIALLRAGRLIAHQPTGELLRSLGLARPIVVTARATAPIVADAAAELGRLPGVREALVSPHPGGQPGGAPGAEGRTPNSLSDASLMQIQIASTDLRATTPALLGWLRGAGWQVLRMEANPVTLTEVFAHER